MNGSGTLAATAAVPSRDSALEIGQPLIGIGYRAELADWIDSHPQSIELLEITAEHFFKLESSPLLTRLSSRYPLVVHGLELSLGTPGPIDAIQLERFAGVVRLANPLWISDHVGFCRAGGLDLGHFVRVAPTEENVAVMGDHAREVSEYCGRPLLLENITSYLEIRGRLSETEFLNRLCERGDCGLLLDVTNLFVNSRNHGFDARSWLLDIEPNRVVQMHVVGYSYDGERWHDSHEEAIQPEIFELVELALSRMPVRAVVIERDGNFPPLEELEAELGSLKAIARGARSGTGAPAPTPTSVPKGDGPRAYVERVPAREPASSPMAPAKDAALFLLDESGVFVSEGRQELHVFNTPATFLWCCLEAGMTQEEMTDRFAGAFGVPRERAEREIGSLLHRWYGLGYVSGACPPAPEPIDLATALAWILTNPGLRADYRLSRDRVARLLCLKDADRDTFLSLDPDGLEAQAQGLERKKRSWRERGARMRRGAGSSPSGVRKADRDFFSSSHYTLGTASFELRFSSRDQEATLRPVLRHLEAAPAKPPEWSLDVLSTPQGHELLLDGEPAASCGSLDQLPPLVKAQIRAAVVNRGDFFMELHAGAVLDGRRCIVFPGAPGSGKSTLTAALAARGFGFFSDEVVLLEEEALLVRPVPLSLTIKPGSIAPLSTYYPQLPALPAFRREDEQQVRYLAPPPESIPHPVAPAPCGVVVFPRYDAAAATGLRSLDRSEALQWIMLECMVLPRSITRSDAEKLTRWMRSLDCYELRFSSLRDAVDAVERISG